MVIPWEFFRTIGPLLSQRLPLASAKAQPMGDSLKSMDHDPILQKCPLFPWYRHRVWAPGVIVPQNFESEQSSSQAVKAKGNPISPFLNFVLTGNKKCFNTPHSRTEWYSFRKGGRLELLVVCKWVQRFAWLVTKAMVTWFFVTRAQHRAFLEESGDSQIKY